MDHHAPTDAPYTPAGTPSAPLLVAWLASTLAQRPAGLSALAAAALDAFEQAPRGSTAEATMGLLSDALHGAMLEGGDGPGRQVEVCPGCEGNAIMTYERDQESGRCYIGGEELFECPLCGYDLTPHLGPGQPVDGDAGDRFIPF
jgi:hypothetical protein